MARSINELDEKDPAAFALLLEVVRTLLELRVAEKAAAKDRRHLSDAKDTMAESFAYDNFRATDRAFWAATAAHDAALAKVTL